MKYIKKFIFSNNFLYKLTIYLKRLKTRYNCKGVIFENYGYARIDKDIIGKNNLIKIGENTIIHKSNIRIRGDNNKLIIDEDCHIGESCSFWMEGNDINIHIGKGTTMTYGVHLCAQENNTKIIIGEDCMLSNTISIRTSDSHPIYSLYSTKRLNNADNVILKNHVWIAPNVKIMKGVRIEEGSIIGTDTIVTKNIPAHALAVGHPAKIVKSEIKWTRERLF